MFYKLSRNGFTIYHAADLKSMLKWHSGLWHKGLTEKMQVREVKTSEMELTQII